MFLSLNKTNSSLFLCVVLIVFGLHLVKVLAFICLPISLTKNIINVIQLVGGFDALAELDEEKREKSN